MKISCAAVLLIALPMFGAAQTRYVPPPGIEVPAQIRDELKTGVAELGASLQELQQSLKGKPASLTLLPDIEIFHKAVEWPLVYGEFYRSNEFAIARTLLRQGMERAHALRNGEAPWTSATGL